MFDFNDVNRPSNVPLKEQFEQVHKEMVRGCAGNLVEKIDLEADPDYRKMQAIGYAIRSFEKECGK